MSKEEKVKKGLAPLAWVLYLLIVFEIIYMISPFALYYYSAYGPGLKFLQKWTITAWLSGFFLPHFSESSAWVLNAAHGSGWWFFLFGLALFLTGAGQIYYAKFAKKGAVTGGLYRLVRNPQYTAFSIMGFGVLLIWPRFMVLVMFVTMLFVYYFLAKKEENECEKKYGDSFKAYVEKTSMFIPGDRFLSKRILSRCPRFPKAGFRRAAAISLSYLAVMGLVVMAGIGLRSYSLASLHAVYVKDLAVVSTVALEQKEMHAILDLALTNQRVKNQLSSAGYGTGKKLLSYIVPLHWVIPDLPMDHLSTSIRGHSQPDGVNRHEYKVLFTVAGFAGDTAAGTAETFEGADIIKHTSSRTPVIVVKMNILSGEILGLETPPAHVLWGDISTPLF